MNNKSGIIYLVGAGPGDPELITLKGARVLGLADVIFYDHLANRELLKMAKPSAQKIYVGKQGTGRQTDKGRGSEKSLPQEEIEKELIARAKKGETVVRLKGGDPFIFGRGGEEALAISRAGIKFEIVPGITAAIAVPAYAGIPLTHRLIASDVAFVTGHQDPSRGEDDEEDRIVPWDALAKMETVVFFMGVATLRENLQKLIAYGKSPDTPAAIISWGTLPEQKTVMATVATLADRAEMEKVTPPSLVVVGSVVLFREKLKWFENKPLFGKRIIVTRFKAQASEFSDLLRERGGSVIELATIDIQPPESFAPLDESIQKIKDFDWLLFTSVNAVDFFWERFRKLPSGGVRKDLRDLAHLKIGVIGPSTAHRLESLGLWVDLIPEEFRQEGMVSAFKKAGIRGKKVLIPRAREGREHLVEELVQMKCEVEVVEAYRNVMPEVKPDELDQVFRSPKPDWITFLSSSSVDNFVRLVGAKKAANYLYGIKVACIGPTTQKSCENHGIKVDLMPEHNTIPALVTALCRFI
ncbi:MAG: uroporphyrinogen-III C-methyltransferase [Deltaproteobacteria bacterium]|nr:uroporphyrinogen-III C-methyltransferase [Deltaproteobacteria bacterium]